MAVTLAPIGRVQYLDNNGVPLSGGKLTTYVAGTTTPVVTYSDTALTPNANPIILDSSGRATIYLVVGSSYKFVLTTSAGAAVWTQDNVDAASLVTGLDVTGVAGEDLASGLAVYLSDGSGGKVAGRWSQADSANTYSNTLPEIGVTTQAITTGNSGVIRIQGLVAGGGLAAGTSYYVGSVGAMTTVAPTPFRLVGIASSATTLLLSANPAAAATNAPITQTSSLTGTQDNFVLTSGVEILYLDSASDITITGFAAGFEGQRVLVIMRGTVTASFTQTGASTSSAANRLVNFAQSAATRIRNQGFVEYEYDATNDWWKLIRHDQGSDITPTFAAANFTASGTMTWTLAAGDVPTCSYRLVGRQLFIRMKLLTTTIGGVVSSQLFVSNGAFGGYTSGASVRQQALVDDNAAGVVTACWAEIGAAATFITIAKNAGGNFTLSTNLTNVYLNMVFEID